MASKTGSELSTKDLEELLDGVDSTMDRLKTLYEQYFLGIQKQAPAYIHTDVERKLRDLTQMNIRNTGLRYRLATLQQKFGSYNSYWRRTLRQIENGTYLRNLAKVSREAARTGSEIPDEILAKMLKRMREQVLRDREQAIAIAERRKLLDAEAGAVAHSGHEDDAPSGSAPRREAKTSSGAHVLDDDGDLDFDQLFAAFSDDDAPKAPSRPTPDPTSTQITRPIPRSVPTADPHAATTAMPKIAPPNAPTTAIPKIPVPTTTGGIPQVPQPGQTSSIPVVMSGPIPTISPGATGAIPRIPAPGQSQAIPRPAPSQATRPNPVAPGSSTQTGPVPVESLKGPFQRPPAERPVTQAVPRVPPPAGTARPGTPPARPPAPAAPQRPPPGMTDADVNALHAKYVQAKQAVGETVDASSREKLLRTINQTAPKIMEQYKASGVDFSVVVKDNQVVIKAKPKT